MPTQILDGPRSDPHLKAPTDPFTPPPLTKIRPRPPVVAPMPVVAPRRRRGRFAAVLVVLAVAGAASGGALAWYEVSASGPALPTARAALGAVGGSGDYVSSPFTDTVTVDMDAVVDSGSDDGFICRWLSFCDSGDDVETFSFAATGSVTAGVALTAVRRSDIVVRRRSATVSVPTAELAAAYVDPASISADDDEGEELLADGEIDQQDIVDDAVAQIEGEALDAGVLRDAQREVRRALVDRLHRAGFRHAYVEFV